MAQTTGAISSKDFKIEGSVNGSAWVDYSGVALKLTPSARERATSETHTADMDTPIVLAGKLSAQVVDVEFLYTEVSTELFDDLQAQHIAAGGGAWYWRWSPKGGQSTEWQFTTTAGFINMLSNPPMDMSGAAAAPVVITAKTIHPSTAQTAVV
jgi:hypothetical protein